MNPALLDIEGERRRMAVRGMSLAEQLAALTRVYVAQDRAWYELLRGIENEIEEARMAETDARGLAGLARDAERDVA